jgi:hypothetical protein
MKEGRPVEMKGKTRGMPYTFYIDPQEKESLEEIRWRERKSMSEIIRKAIDEYIRLHAEGNDTYTLDNWELNQTMQAIPNIFATDKEIVEDYRSSNKEDRKMRFESAMRRIQLYKNVNFEESKKHLTN